MKKHAELIGEVKEWFELWGFKMYKERLVPTKGFDVSEVVREIARKGSTKHLVRVDLIGYFPCVRIWEIKDLERNLGTKILEEDLDDYEIFEKFYVSIEGMESLSKIYERCGEATVRGFFARRLILQERLQERFTILEDPTIAIEVSRAIHPVDEAKKLREVPTDFKLIVSENYEGFIKYRGEEIYCARIDNLYLPDVFDKIKEAEKRSSKALKK